MGNRDPHKPMLGGVCSSANYTAALWRVSVKPRLRFPFFMYPIFPKATSLTHISLASYKRNIGKQCRPRSDATERGVWSGSTLFALSSETLIKHGNNKNLPYAPYSGNGPVRRVKVEKSIRHKWVKFYLITVCSEPPVRPANTQRRSNTVTTSWRCSDVVRTFLRRCVFPGRILWATTAQVHYDCLPKCISSAMSEYINLA